jgi:hypothetical protein
MFLVDGARSFRRAYDLDRGTKRDCRLRDTVSTQMTQPSKALCASGARYSFGERFLVVVIVVIGENLDTKRWADSTLPVPAEGAGGLRLR